VLKHLGLSTSEFISMTFRQLIMRRGLPFDARISNEETIAALKESTGDYKAGRQKTYSGAPRTMPFSVRISSTLT